MEALHFCQISQKQISFDKKQSNLGNKAKLGKNDKN